MLELICSIPENIGWAIVGFISCLCLIMFIKLCNVFIEMWRDRKEAGVQED